MSESDDIPPPPAADFPPLPNLPPVPNPAGPVDDFRTRSYLAQPSETATGFRFDGPADDQRPNIPDFVILDVLGSGGMGVVYKARQLRLNRTVALKVIRQDLARHADWDALRKRFAEEATSLARLQHPHIVQIHDAAEHAGQSYIVMEFVAGGGLDGHLKGGKLPPAAVAAEMVRTLARAVQAAHDRHIVHRDLKPSNVLVTPDGTLKIADFGLAKLLDDATDGAARHSVVGTPGYMAPEQVLGEPISPLMDVYALGAILYKLLVNHPPFSADTLTTLNRMVCELPPVPPRQQQSRIPRSLEAICLKCLEKEPGRRYASASALADDLDRFLRGEPTAARPVGRGRRLAMWARRRPATAALLTSVTLLVLVGIGFVSVAVTNAFLEREKLRVESALAREEEKSRSIEYTTTRINLAEQRSEARHVVSELGWREKSLADIRWAASLDQPTNVERLRQILAATETRIDLQVVGTLAENINPYCLAVSPDGMKVVTGAVHGAVGADIVLHRRDGQVFRTTVTDGTGTSANGIRALTFSSDGRWLIAGSRGGQVVAWDTNEAGTAAIPLKQRNGKQINGIGFTQDGSKVVATSADKTASAWNTKTWEPIVTMKFADDREPLGIGFSPIDERIFVGFANGLRLSWASYVQAGSQDFFSIREVDALAGVRHVQFAPDGTFVALATHDNRIVLHGAMAERTIQSLVDPPAQFAHQDPINGLSMDPTGTLLASGGSDNYLKLWDTTSGRLLLRVFLAGDEGVVPAFDPASGDLLVAANRKLTRYRIVRPDTMRVMGPQVGPVGAVAFAENEAVVSAMWQLVHASGKWRGDISVWSPTTGRPINRHQVLKKEDSRDRPKRPSIAVDPTGQTIVSGGIPGVDYLTWHWRAEKPKSVPLPKDGRGMQSFLRFAPDGKFLWGIHAPDGKIDFVRMRDWPSQNDRLAKADRMAHILAKRAGLTCLDVGRTWAAVGSADCTVKMISAADPQAAWRPLSTGEENPICAVALSPDEALVLAGTRRGQVAAFQLPSGEPIDIPVRHNDRVEALAFSPDGKLLATGGRDNTIRLWERSGEQFRSLMTFPTAGPVIDLKFSPDGRRLAFVVENQRAFNVWDLGLFRQNLANLGLDW